MYFRLLHLGQKHIIGIINKETEHHSVMMKMFVNKFPVYQYHTFSRKSGSLQLNMTTLHCVYLQRRPGFLVGSVLLIALVACVVLLCVFKF
jgi:hypothetical protein